MSQKKEYELVSIFWDEITSKPNEPLDFVRHRRGDRVQLDSEQARRLLAAGAVVEPGAREAAALAQAKAEYERAAAAFEAVKRATPDTVLDEVTKEPSGAPSLPFDINAGVKDLLKYVDDDVDRAKAVLAAEKQAKGDDVRASLVGPLGKIIDPPAGG